MRTSFVTAALAATATALDASVWTFDTTSKGPAISPENARLVLAHRLGLSRYHKLEKADEHTLKLLNKAQEPLFAPASSSRKLMLVIEGLEQGLLDELPSFTISNPPSSSSNQRLVSDLLYQDMHNREAAQCGKPHGSGLIQGGFSAANPAGLCLLGTQKDLSPKEQLSVLSGDASAMDTVHGQTLSLSATSDYTAIFHVGSLEDAAQKHGVESPQYHKTRSSIQNIISEARESRRFGQVIIVAMPLQNKLAKRDSYGAYEMPLKSRMELPLTDTTFTSSAVHSQKTSSSNRTIPKTTISTCWSSEKACNANTADCSGHGSCILKYSEKVSDDETGAECWACACTPTKLNNGKKTIYWGGPACQKKDISVPFFLFAGFTIAAIAALSYGIGLLYSIGEEDLPSVLGAGVAPPNRK